MPEQADMSRVRLTRTHVTKPPGEQAAILWDTEVTGFGARFQGGSWRFLVKYRTAGRQRWVTLGAVGSPWTVQTARAEARRLLGLVAGEDPADVRDRAARIPNLRELSERYLTEYAEPNKAQSSVESDRANLRRAILPALGRYRLDKITNPDVVRFHLSRKKTPVNANRCLSLLSHMFKMAEVWGLLPLESNPCKRVRKFREEKRKRFLSEAELARLGAALVQVEESGTVGPSAVAAIRLLVFTGARKSEIQGLRWEEVNLERGMLRLRTSKTGAKRIHLNAPAMELLANLPKLQGNPHVIVGAKPGRHLSNLEHSWQSVRRLAELEDVRIHDLRHSFASIAVSGGASLPIIGGLLSHTQAATTQRYAHLSESPLRATSEMVGKRIASAMNKREASKPKPADHAAARRRRRHRK